MSVTLCDRFHDLNPIKIRQYPAREVFLLIKRLLKHNQRQTERKHGEGATVQNGVIYKKAGDNWY